MNKSVYSLVLSDEIVQEIDRMAYEMGQSRSAMINQVLADYVRYTTPEKRMREVFSAIEQMLLGSALMPLVGLAGEGTALPMAAMMAACFGLSVICFAVRIAPFHAKAPSVKSNQK